jgi:hypothetical protein
VFFRCQRACEPGSEYCFWHSDCEKTAEEIQQKKAEADAQGEALQRALLYGPHLEGVDLSGGSLVEARFGAGKPTILRKANLSATDLWRARFEGSEVPLDLSHARFDNARLHETRFENVNLDGADFGHAILLGTTFRDASMKGARLGDVRRFDSVELRNVVWEVDKVNAHERAREWGKATRVYQAAKQAYTRQGDLDTAGELFFREMKCRRKGAVTLRDRVSYTFLYLFWGYGEKPFRALVAAAVSIALFAVLYAIADPSWGFLRWLYFSAVSFTALGYDWLPTPSDLMRVIGIVEAVWGLIMSGAFLVTLTRKMTR